MSVRLKKNLGRLQAWAGGAGRMAESSPLPAATPDAVAKTSEPPKDQYEAACAGKEKYPSKQAANAAQLYREQSGVRNEGMIAYRCRFCGSWHLGHANR